MTLGSWAGFFGTCWAQRTAPSRRGSWHSSRGCRLWWLKTSKSSFVQHINRFLPLLPVKCTPMSTQTRPHTRWHHRSMLLSESCESVLPAWSTNIIAVCTTVSLREGTGDRAGSAGRAFLTHISKGHQFLWVTALATPESHCLGRSQTKKLIRTTLGVKGYFSKMKEFFFSCLKWCLDLTQSTYFKPLILTEFLHEKFEAVGYLSEQAWEMGGTSTRWLKSEFPSFPKRYQIQPPHLVASRQDWDPNRGYSNTGNFNLSSNTF